MRVAFTLHIPCSVIARSLQGSSVVECLTRDRQAAGTSLTGVTALFP